jgi:hypothetical protein
VVDIKPYIPYADGISDASCGFTRERVPEITAVFSPAAARFCRHYLAGTGRDLRRLVLETLRYDPRPASQRTVGREYGMLLWNVNVRWRVTEEGFEVLSCEEVTAK